MDTELLVCLKVTRDKFYQENYIDRDHIFALVRSGSFSLSSPSGEYTVGPMEGALFLANVRYYRKVLTPVTMYLFRFRSKDTQLPGEHIVFRNIERIRSTLDFLDTLEGTPKKNGLNLHHHLFQDLMVQQQVESFHSKGQDTRIQKILAYMQHNLSQKLSLSELAAYAGLSYAQFFRLFKESTGTSPSDHILILRMQKAKQLLANSDFSIREIASACGFDNEFYFSNVFKKHAALPPSTFRRQFR